MKLTGVHLGPASADCFPLRAAKQIPAELQFSTALTLEQIQSLTDSIAVYDEYIEHLVDTQYPKAKLLQQIPGVGALTSLAFILTLDDPARFSEKPTSGMLPRAEAASRSIWRQQSAARDHQKR